MTFNLGHPDNKQANLLAQCQRVAALWVNQLRLNRITRAKVERCIAEHSTEEQALIRHWLNEYMDKTRHVVKPFTRRKVPEWVRR